MNEANVKYLQDQIKYTGFGDGLDKQLRDNIEKQLPEFSLRHTARFGKDELTSTLHFKRSANSELYFFNSYLASLKEQHSRQLNQLFYTQRPGAITLKEAFNLMQGRAVHKELVDRQGESYRAWIQLDFKNTEQNGNYKYRVFHQNYGFDLDRSLSALPIKELSDPASKAHLVSSLQKGNRQMVTFLEGAKEHRMILEANPQFKAIIVFDQNAVRQQHSRSQQHSTEQTVPAHQKKSLKNTKDKGLSVS